MSGTATPSSKDEAIRLLRDTSWFQDGSEGFLDSLAHIMVPINAEDGHIFLEEGSPVNTFLVLESGTLVRTKLSADAAEKVDLQKSLRSLKGRLVTDELNKSSVVVDTLTARGRVSGMLHVIEDGNFAYATVTARGGPAKVWLVPGQSFRDLLAANQNFSMEFLSIMSRELRTGTKSVRSLIRQVKNSGDRWGTPEDESAMLRVLCYDSTSWVSESFKPAIEAFNGSEASASGIKIYMDFTIERLGRESATHASGYDAVCTFVNDTADAETIQTLSLLGVQMIAQRAAGFDRIDTKAAKAYGMTVARVPAYSPYAVAEFAVTLLMTVNRKIAKASQRVRMANFSLDAGLMGMDVYGKTIGVMGTGKIGQILCKIILGFGAKLICYDVFESDEIKNAGGTYVSQDEIYARSDVLFLMMPLLPSTKHTINEGMLNKLKKGVIVINSSRGALVDTKALLKGIQSGIIAGAGMDVYENEADYFFQDWSARHIQDPTLVALLGEQNVVLTAHQAFFTREAVGKIVDVTIDNLRMFKQGKIGMDHPNNCIPSTFKN
jgi:D-lactate dehydrogenase